MTRRDHYRAALGALDVVDWDGFLRANSGLPGPRGNLELASAVADEGDLPYFDHLIATDEEYLVFCGAVGLGQVLASTPDADAAAAVDLERRLRTHATDERWRIREGVAMALQRVGDADAPRLLRIATAWAADPHPLVQRAALAGICEPRLLVGRTATSAVDLCAQVTDALAAIPGAQRSRPHVRTLRQALGYCWSVAVAANPGYGLPRFLELDTRDDRDVAWIARENRRKQRLAKLL